MTELVDPDKIEATVGARRHVLFHLGRAVSAEQTVYILHSHACRATEVDARSCGFSLALDTNGVDLGRDGWVEDQTVVLAVFDGRLVVGLAQLPHDVELLVDPGDVRVPNLVERLDAAFLKDEP